MAQLKVKALKTSEVAVTGAGAGTQRTQGDYDFPSIQLAATHFLGEDSDVIRQAILRTMEGHQRQILGTLTGAFHTIGFCSFDELLHGNYKIAVGIDF